MKYPKIYGQHKFDFLNKKKFDYWFRAIKISLKNDSKKNNIILTDKDIDLLAYNLAKDIIIDYNY